MRLTQLALRAAAWRAPIYSIPRSALHASLALQRLIPKDRCQQFAISSKTAATAREQGMDENLLKMDIDVVDKHMKEWFGDHAAWSHEKLLKLVYGTAHPRIFQAIR